MSESLFSSFSIFISIYPVVSYSKLLDNSMSYSYFAVTQKYPDEIVVKITEQSQLDITNPRSEEYISIVVVEKRSGYLKGYGMCKISYTAKFQIALNSEVLAEHQEKS
ncbi:hypothetical protein Dimus_038564 [Dionaea muscipula]